MRGVCMANTSLFVIFQLCFELHSLTGTSLSSFSHRIKNSLNPYLTSVERDILSPVHYSVSPSALQRYAIPYVYANAIKSNHFNRGAYKLIEHFNYYESPTWLLLLVLICPLGVYLQQINTYDAYRIIVAAKTDTTNSSISHLPSGWAELRCLLNHATRLRLYPIPADTHTQQQTHATVVLFAILALARPLPLLVRRIWKPTVFAGAHPSCHIAPWSMVNRKWLLIASEEL